jgi:rfaE bifunctional protein nucleotidyltransferase chain/domain
VREIKGVGRPIVSQEFRKRFLDAINCVDEVIIFDEITPIQLIKTIKPDVIFKGGDYKENEIVGHDFVKSYGGDIRVLNRFFDVSTTKIVNSFKSSI